MINFQKKQVKIISVIVAAVFILSIVALGVTQYESGLAGASSSNVGVVDYKQLRAQHPGMQAASEKYEEAAKQARAEFEQQVPNMTPEQQHEFMVKKEKEMQEKTKELLDPINSSIEEQIKAVADTRGINVVLDKENVLYGGQDITQDVLKKLQEQGDDAAASSDAASTSSDAAASSDAAGASSDAAGASSDAAASGDASQNQ